MGLRLKNAIAVTSVFLAVISATYLLYTRVLLREFDAIERERASLNIQRVFQSIDGVTDDLRSRTVDWARWDETYQFMQGKNRGYLSTNVNYEAIAPFELVHIAFLSPLGSLVSGQEVVASEETLRPLAPETFKAILSNKRVNDYLSASASEPLSGLIRINHTPLFIAISPITDNQGSRTPNGFLVFTRAFSSQLQSQIKKRTQLDLTFEDADEERLTTRSQATSSSSVATQGDEVLSRGILQDITGMPIISFSHRAPRTIYQQGKASRDYVVSLMAICLVFANVILIVFLNRAVIGRLERFAARIKTIASTTDFSLRVTLDGADEIGSLSETFNSLLQTTEYTTNQLAHARDAALRATEAKSRFVAHVSHELRTPIHGLTGLLRILFKGESSPTKRAYIQMAQDSASTLLATINNILDLSKIESGAVELQHIPFSLREVLRSAVQTVSPRIDEKPSLHFLIDIEPGVADNMVGDPLRLQQILVNVLGNAAKFTNEGSISLRVAPEAAAQSAPGLLFEIADTGIGMNEEELARIFQPFTQADDSIQATYGGTGLGLSITQSLVDQLKGRLSVKSTPQKGTTFSISLPVETKGPPLSSISTSLPIRCALVDEESPFSTWMSEGLARFNCEVERLSPHDESAMNRLAQSVTPPDFVLISPRALEVPIIIEGLPAIRQSLRCPIIVSLKSSDMTAHARMLALGEITIVDTPSSPEEVIRQARAPSTERCESFVTDDLTDLAPSTRCRILVADDAPTSRLIIREMLEEAGYQVETVDDGRQLFDRVREMIEHPEDDSLSLVLTDIEMPYMSGLQATQEIRALERRYPERKPLPVIAITAHALTDEQRRFREGGIDYVVTKPINPRQLNEALQRLLSSDGKNQPIDLAHEPNVQPLSTVLCDLTARLWGEVTQRHNSHQQSQLSQGIDIADVFERSGESPRRTKLILNAFLGSYLEPLKTLKSVSSTGDMKEATIAAHSLKGLLLDVGATQTAGLAASIERSLKAGDFASAADYCSMFTEETSKVATLIERVIRHFPSV